MAGANRRAYTVQQDYGDEESFERECYLLDPIHDGDSAYYGADGEDVPEPHISRHTVQPLTQRYGTRPIMQRASRQRIRTTEDDTEYRPQRQAPVRPSQRDSDYVLPQQYRVVPLFTRFRRACGWVFVGMCLMLFLVLQFGPAVLGR